MTARLEMGNDFSNLYVFWYEKKLSPAYAGLMQIL